MEKDPVCGMEVNPKAAAGTSIYQGKTYYFCSVEDKQAFDKEPQRYIKPQMQSGEHMQHH